MSKKKLVFASVVYANDFSERAALLLGGSIRAFAGSLSSLPIWYFVPEYGKEISSRSCEKLKALGIGVSVHFIPLHLHPYYRKTYGYEPDDLPVASDCYRRSLSLPIYSRMTDESVDRVIAAVTDLTRRLRR